MLRYQSLFVGFFGDDLSGNTILAASRWYHTAFVFDSATRNQSLYLDGVLESTHQSNSPYQGVPGSLTIGMSQEFASNHYFDGLIDQLSYTNRSKSSVEILQDATLTLYYSFNGNSTFDEGPLRIKGSLVGATGFVSGPMGQALQISDPSDSYLIVGGLVLLGRDNQSYSFSIWIQPTVVRQSSIIHMSSEVNGTGLCVPIIALTGTNQLITTSWVGSVVKVAGPIVPTNSWTHVVVTYKLRNGLRLYVNGSLYNASSPFAYQAGGTPKHLFVGSPRMGGNCSDSSVSGQY